MATATENSVLEAQPRTSGNKNVARRVRRAGKIPGVVYGAGKPAITVTLDPRQVTRILHSATGHNTIFDLALNGAERSKAMIVDWQYEPIKGSLLHIDLKRIAMDQKLKVSVPIVLKGEAAGVKQQGGILEQILREVEVECLPADIPEEFKVDVSDMLIGKQLRAGDLPFDRDKVKLLTDPVRVLAHVVILKKEEEPAPEAAVAAETAPAEPEVIKKGKKDEEGDAEAAAEPAAKAEKPEKKGKEK